MKTGFARVLGETPLTKEPIIAEFYDACALAEESFGPPEKSNNLLFWKFVRADGAFASITTSRSGRLTLRASKCPEFFVWVNECLGETGSGERAPAFMVNGMAIEAF